jgi:hypothetical protein
MRFAKRCDLEDDSCGNSRGCEFEGGSVTGIVLSAVLLIGAAVWVLVVAMKK